jgi:hypothetical protein
VGTYNASGAWFVPDTQLFFMAGLDPARTYNLTLKNDGASPWLKLWFTSLTLFQLPRDSSNAGAPAAPAASTGSVPLRRSMMVRPAAHVCRPGHHTFAISAQAHGQPRSRSPSSSCCSPHSRPYSSCAGGGAKAWLWRPCQTMCPTCTTGSSPPASVRSVRPARAHADLQPQPPCAPPNAR